VQAKVNKVAGGCFRHPSILLRRGMPNETILLASVEYKVGERTPSDNAGICGAP
jgi:hypothetical protein